MTYVKLFYSRAFYPVASLHNSDTGTPNGDLEI